MEGMLNMRAGRVLRLVAAALCLALAIVALCACGEKEIKKQRVTDGSVWVFGEARVTGGSSADETSDIDASIEAVYEEIVCEGHRVIYFDDALQTQQALDYIEFKEGKVYLCHYSGEGNPSFWNGAEIYESYASAVVEIGTYSGTEITISYNDYSEAYIANGELVLRSVSSSEGLGYVFDAIFFPEG